MTKWPECFRLCGHKNMINWQCDLPLSWFHCSYSLITSGPLMHGGHIWTRGDRAWFRITVCASLICSMIFVHKSFISSRPNLHLSFIIFELFHANVRHSKLLCLCTLMLLYFIRYHYFFIINLIIFLHSQYLKIITTVKARLQSI